MTKALYPVSRLLARNLNRLKDHSRVLWINPPPDHGWCAMAGFAPGLRLHSQEISDHNWLKRSGAVCSFGDFPMQTPKSQDLLILSLPRSKPLLEMMLHCAHNLLKSGGEIWLAGENRAGIKSAETALGRWFGQSGKLDYGSHCVLFQATAPLHAAPFDATAYQDRWNCRINGSQFEVCSWPGIFSHGRLDDGTGLLLEHLPAVKAGSSALDFACGSGVIGAGLARTCPGLDLTVSDSNALSLRAASCTLKTNHLQGAVVASDGLIGITRNFDLIISNPPFHQGAMTNTSMSMELLHGVRNFLTSRGQLVLVVNRHIPYRKWLDGIFGKHRILAENSRYQVLSAGQSA